MRAADRQARGDDGRGEIGGQQVGDGCCGRDGVDGDVVPDYDGAEGAEETEELCGVVWGLDSAIPRRIRAAIERERNREKKRGIGGFYRWRGRKNQGGWGRGRDSQHSYSQRKQASSAPARRPSRSP